MNVNRKELLSALKQAVRVTPNRTPRPTLQNVMLESAGPLLYVKATDLETHFQTHIGATGGPDRQFQVLVNAKDARDIVKSLSGDTVAVGPIGSFDAQIGGMTLIGEDPNLMPSIPVAFSGATGFNLGAEHFASLIKRVAFAAAREESRYAISGIMIELKNGVLRLVATDGRRLALSEVTGMGEGDFQIILPAAAMNTLRMALGKRDSLGVGIEGDHAQFRFGSTVMVLRQLENRFPEYSAVIPKSAPVRVYIDRKPLEAALNQLKVYTSADVSVVRFDVAQGELTLSAKSADRGEGSVVLTVTREGSGFMGLNPEYLLQALKASDKSEVRMDFEDENSPVLFDLGFTYVQMPISGV